MPESRIRRVEKLTAGHKVLLGIIVFLIVMAWLHGTLKGPSGGARVSVNAGPLSFNSSTRVSA